MHGPIRHLAFWLALAGLALTSLACYTTANPVESTDGDSGLAAGYPIESEALKPRGPGFRSQKSLDDHYRKHHREFGDITVEQYLALAQQLRDAPKGGSILEIVRADRVITRFDQASGYFGAYNPDGIIRTFFVPNDGVRYFQRQANRPH